MTLSQYHFCIRVTPKILSYQIFQNKAIFNFYKLEILKGNKPQSYHIEQRNLHNQALQGYYRSQTCYLQVKQYLDSNPIQYFIKFTQLTAGKRQQKQNIIFEYHLSTYTMVKDYNQRNINRVTKVVSNSFDTEFYLDIYIQKFKQRLKDKVRSDSNQQMIKKQYLVNEGERSETDHVRSITNTPKRTINRVVYQEREMSSAGLMKMRHSRYSTSVNYVKTQRSLFNSQVSESKSDEGIESKKRISLNSRRSLIKSKSLNIVKPIQKIEEKAIPTNEVHPPSSEMQTKKQKGKIFVLIILLIISLTVLLNTLNVKQVSFDGNVQRIYPSKKRNSKKTIRSKRQNSKTN